MKNNIWQQIDEAFWRGELLHFGSEIASANLKDADYDVANLLFRSEAGTLDGSNRKYVDLVETLGQEGPVAHSARAALGYANYSFFIGDWQTCLDALHQSAVTALKSAQVKSSSLRKLRAEAYLCMADYWALFRQPGKVLIYLHLAHLAFRESSARIYSRLRLLFAKESSSPGALIQLVNEGKWGTVYYRLVNRFFSDLPQITLPEPTVPEDIVRVEGLRAAFEASLAEALNPKTGDRLSWAKKAVNIAELMKTPAWLAVADITTSFLAERDSDLRLAERHLYRATTLIKEHNLGGLLVYAMLANLPILEDDAGKMVAADQAQDAVKQVLNQAVFFRDPVLRRRFIWAFETVFINAFDYAREASRTDLAFSSILKCKGLGRAASNFTASNENEILQAREKETGSFMVGEELFEPHSMLNGVFGPHPKRLPGIYGEVDTMLKISDTIARSELLQLVREKVFGMSTNIPVQLSKLPEDIMEIFFLIDNERIWRIDRFGEQEQYTQLQINYTSLLSSIRDSGLSMTMANRRGPIDYGPLEKCVEQLLAGLPNRGKWVKRIRIWPHGLLYSIPFTYAARSLLPQAPSITVILGIEKCRFNSNNGRFPAIRLAPWYIGDSLPFASAEVQDVGKKTEIIFSGTKISAECIIKCLLRSPALFHFAGHAVNRNDEPELAGLYASDLTLVSVADILNIGCGPKATVLSACETGLGPLHSSDGSYSLPRAFLQTGSEWVLASLWKIGDQETYSFMKLFFKNLEKSIEPEAALPQERHPFVLYRSN